MNTGVQNKRARTIDAFFSRKQAKSVLDVEPPHAPGVLAQSPKDSAGETNKDVLAPRAPAHDALEVGVAATHNLQSQPPLSRGATAGCRYRGGSPDVLLSGADITTSATEPNSPPASLPLLHSGTTAAAPAAGAGAAVDVDVTVSSPGGQERDTAPSQAPALVPAAPQGTCPPGATAADDGLTPAQRAQITANRNRALARRVVVESSAPGGPPLQLSALLVERSWREALVGELAGANMRQLEAFLNSEWSAGRKPVFPTQECIFQALNACPFDKVRVVILGQDPYHGPGQAMGLAFSVPRDLRSLPPSLINIYKEAAVDLGWADRPQHGDLSAWSVQGVLLLNTCLTVRQGEANSHSKKGWEAFTDATIRALSERRSGLVFLLWGSPAQAKASLVNTRKHHVLKAPHPSPLSASRGFFGCRHFSKANQLLQSAGLEPVDWRLT